jgi:peptidoglycan/LPS O-acetylase OafA/YrhL
MTPQGELKHLTGLRGLLACWVVSFHYAYFSGGYSDLGWFVSKGYLAVDGFLILSGYVLARSYANHVLKRPGYARYLIRRAGRIFPLHLSVLVAIIALGRAPVLKGALPEAALINRWEILPKLEFFPINPPDWSLSAEWAMSLALPVFILLYVRSHLALKILAGIGAAVVLLVTFWFHGPQTSPPGSIWPITRCACDFALGVLLSNWRGTHRLGVIAAILALPPFVWLGEISFAVYLVHMETLHALRPSIAAVGGIFAIATFFHFTIERPARRWSRNVSNKIGRLEPTLRPASLESPANSPGG